MLKDEQILYLILYLHLSSLLKLVLQLIGLNYQMQVEMEA